MAFSYFGRIGGVSATGFALYHAGRRFYDQVDGTRSGDAFAQHTLKQHRAHLFSGMHEPYIPSPEQQAFFLKHFPQHSHLLPRSLEEFQQQQALKSVVRIASLKDSPFVSEFKGEHTIVVGGPPALVSSANERGITYVRDLRAHPIAFGSAWHLEHDGISEAATTHQPSQFMKHQILRALFKYESLESAEKTGQFSWRTLDWVGWLQHPEHWAEGVRVALAFQRVTNSYTDSEKRKEALQEAAQRCKANEKFYEDLNKELDGKLLSEANGAIIIARNSNEERDLHLMKQGLEIEKRHLRMLSSDEMQERYGFVPPGGIAFGEKVHDRILSTNVMSLLAQRVQDQGGEVINGVLTAIYTDLPEKGGIVRLTTPDGNSRCIPFSKLVLSLGSQRILNQVGDPLYDTVSARGVSVLGVAYVPQGQTIPQGTVCGGTNNVIRLSDAVEIVGKDGKTYDGYLVRMTAGACVTPNVSEKSSANYDGTIATGLIAAARQTLGFEIEPFVVYGCNRQFSQHGETHWVSVAPNPVPQSLLSLTPRGQDQDLGTFRPDLERGIFVQYGAGGGGLTQAPSQPPAALDDKA